ADVVRHRQTAMTQLHLQPDCGHVVVRDGRCHAVDGDQVGRLYATFDGLGERAELHQLHAEFLACGTYRRATVLVRPHRAGRVDVGAPGVPERIQMLDRLPHAVLTGGDHRRRSRGCAID